MRGRDDENDDRECRYSVAEMENKVLTERNDQNAVRKSLPTPNPSPCPLHLTLPGLLYVYVIKFLIVFFLSLVFTGHFFLFIFFVAY